MEISIIKQMVSKVSNEELLGQVAMERLRQKFVFTNFIHHIQYKKLLIANHERLLRSCISKKELTSSTVLLVMAILPLRVYCKRQLYFSKA